MSEQKRYAEAERVAADHLRSMPVITTLAERYYAAMPLPFDPKYADRDEEVEATAAMREATKRAATDLNRIADGLSPTNQDQAREESER